MFLVATLHCTYYHDMYTCRDNMCNEALRQETPKWIASSNAQVIVYGAKIEINGIVYLFPYMYISFYSTSFKDTLPIFRLYHIYYELI